MVVEPIAMDVVRHNTEALERSALYKPVIAKADTVIKGVEWDRDNSIDVASEAAVFPVLNVVGRKCARIVYFSQNADAD